MHSPICFFTYNRQTETQKAITALKENPLSKESDLFIFSDGAKKADEVKIVNEVRQYIKGIDGFKSVTIYESTENKGLANSIISGVTKIIDQYGKIIVLEDDLITSPNFLDFMNQALDFYNGDTNIHSISGYTLNLPSLNNYPKDYYLGYRASSWGWGTWKEKWQTVDWEVRNYNQFSKNPFEKIKFMRGGSDMPGMLKDQMKGRIDSWAIRWCFDQFQKDQMTIYPSRSKIVSIGFGETATHTKRAKRFQTFLDKGNQRNFTFDKNLSINKLLMKEFRHKFSVWSRLQDKFI